VRVLSHRHTAIIVADLDRMIDFYVALGFEQRRRDHEEGEFISHLLGLENLVLESVKLALPDGYVIELIKHISHDPPPRPEAAEGHHPPRYGLDHIGVTVDDIEAVVEKAQALGGRLISSPKWTNPGLPSIHAYVTDPENNLIHIAQNA
jgi:catechol 2,3-dioxygenase-like lactoylglutathione lyase family enzyme